MKFTIALLLSAASLATAQTTTAAASSPQSSCQAQNIVDTCVAGYQDRIDACNKNSNDWICLCDVYTDVLTCYNNCPDSNEKPPVQNQVTQYCQAAAPLKSSSLAAAATAAKTSVAPASSAAATGTATASETATGTKATASAFNTGAAGAIAAPVGGVFAVLLGVAGLL